MTGGEQGETLSDPAGTRTSRIPSAAKTRQVCKDLGAVRRLVISDEEGWVQQETGRPERGSYYPLPIISSAAEDEAEAEPVRALSSSDSRGATG